MKYVVKATPFLLGQIGGFDKKTRRVIYNKVNLVESNPFRNKAVKSKSYNHVVRIRFSHQGEEKRLIYVIIRDKVFLCFVLDRSNDYKDLEAYSRKIGKLD